MKHDSITAHGIKISADPRKRRLQIPYALAIQEFLCTQNQTHLRW